MATFRTTQHAISTSSASSFQITKPTGLAVGDKLFAIICFHHGSSGTIATPSGWTAPEAQKNYANNSSCSRVFYKTADATDVAASNFTFSSSASAAYSGILGAVLGVGDLDKSTSGTAAGDSSTTVDITATGITPTRPGTYIVLTGAKVHNGGFNGMGTPSLATDNPSWTELYDDAAANDINAPSAAVAWASRSQTTATGTVSASVGTDSSVNDGGALFLLVFSDTLTVSLSAIAPSATAVNSISGFTGTYSTDVIVGQAPTMPDPTAGQADWSSQQKSSAPTWTAQSKS